MTNPNEKEWWQAKVDETFQKPGEYVPRDRSLEQLASCHDGTNEVWEAVDDAREQSRRNDHFNRMAIHEAVHDLTREIVVEAERRGRVAAWEEMKREIRDALSSFCYVGMPRDAVESARRSGSQGGMNSLADSLRKRINAKLTELKKV